MRQKNQKMRFCDAELELMKRVFSDNEDLLFIIRKVLFQFELSEAESVILKDNLSENVRAVLKKMLAPELDPESPLFQITDLQLGLNMPMGTKGEDEMKPQFEAKQLEIDYLTQQLESLNGKVEEKIKFSELTDLKKDSHEVFVNITARNWLILFIDSSLQQIKFLAGEKNETLEQTMHRLSKDSSK